MFKRLFGIGRNPNQLVVDGLYEQIVAAARQPAFYADWGVPDTPLGRFEMVSLCLFLVLRRLRGKTGAAAEIAQDLVDTFFLEMDHSIRELGVGDIGVPKRMKKLAKMFYGRTASYGEAIDAGDHAALSAALSRNIWPSGEHAPGATGLARYALAAADALAAQQGERIVAGAIRFPAAAEVRPGAAA